MIKMRRKYNYVVMDKKMNVVLSRHKTKPLAEKNVNNPYEKIMKIPKGKKAPEVLTYYKQKRRKRTKETKKTVKEMKFEDLMKGFNIVDSMNIGKFEKFKLKSKMFFRSLR